MSFSVLLFFRCFCCCVDNKTESHLRADIDMTFLWRCKSVSAWRRHPDVMGASRINWVSMWVEPMLERILLEDETHLFESWIFETFCKLQNSFQNIVTYLIFGMFESASKMKEFGILTFWCFSSFSLDRKSFQRPPWLCSYVTYARNGQKGTIPQYMVPILIKILLKTLKN